MTRRFCMFMITWFVLSGLIATSHAETVHNSWMPLKLHVDCQRGGRTKACHAFIRSFIDENPLIEVGPRSHADITIFFNATQLAQEDVVNLHFKGAGLLNQSFQINTHINTRATDDEQRAALKPAFDKGVAFFLATHVPDSVSVSFSVPEEKTQRKDTTTPWSKYLWVGGHGSWSKRYQSHNLYSGIATSRITAKTLFTFFVDGNYGGEKRPPLVVDGETVSLDTSHYALKGGVGYAYNWAEEWSSLIYLRGGHSDPEAQYDMSIKAHGGISYDVFPSDDPRGNRFTTAYILGYQKDVYNRRNAINQTESAFPTHGILGSASVRQDRHTYGLDMSIQSELLNPERRYVIEVVPHMTFKLGDHVDIRFGINLTKQAIPGPAEVDMESFEDVTRSSYAEPLRISGDCSVYLHWDRTNTDRNNRWELRHRMNALKSI